MLNSKSECICTLAFFVWLKRRKLYKDQPLLTKGNKCKWIEKMLVIQLDS